jgi:hypothetical protein
MSFTQNDLIDLGYNTELGTSTSIEIKGVGSPVSLNATQIIQINFNFYSN